MKKNIPIFLLAGSVVITVFSFIITFSAVSSFEENSVKLSKLKEGKELILTKGKEEKNLMFAKLSREKIRGEELRSEISNLEEEFSRAESALNSKLQEISDLEDKIKTAEEEISSFGQKEGDLMLEKKNLQANIVELTSQITKLESEIERLRSEKSQKEFRISELSEKLSGYAEITSILRLHYQNSLRGIREYIRNRPWIEPGDELKPSFHKYDSATGTVAIPLGTEVGIRQGMLFSLQHNNQEICKIKIILVMDDKSVGSIIPLLGTPSKLIEAPSVDLVNL